MKIIPQLTQLSDSELKDIFNNDPEVMTKIIEDAFLNSNLKSAAESFASEIMERMKKAFQILVENMISEEFFAMLDEAEENGKNLSRNGYYSRLIRSSFGEFPHWRCSSVPFLRWNRIDHRRRCRVRVVQSDQWYPRWPRLCRK